MAQVRFAAAGRSVLVAAVLITASASPAFAVPVAPQAPADVIDRCSRLAQAMGPVRSPRKDELRGLIANPTIRNLRMIARANPDDLEPPPEKPNVLRERLISLAFDYTHDEICQTYYAASAIQNLYPEKPIGTIAEHAACGLKNAVEAENYDLVVVYATIFRRAGRRWAGLSGALQYAIAHMPAHDGAHATPLVARLVPAYLSVARDEAADFVANSVLRPEPLARTPSAQLICGVRLGTVSGSLAKSGFEYADRVAVATALFRDAFAMRNFLNRFRPSLLVQGNEGFGGDHEIRDALLNTPDSGTLTPRRALELMLLDKFIVARAARDDERTAAEVTFSLEFGRFAAMDAAEAADADLQQLIAAGTEFNGYVDNAGDDVAPVDVAKVAGIMNARHRRLAERFIDLVAHNAVARSAVVAAAACAAWYVLLLVWPLPLLRLEQWLVRIRDNDVPFVSKALNLGFVMMLINSRYVQDAWVRRYLRLGIPNELIEEARGLVPVSCAVREQEMKTFAPLPWLVHEEVQRLAKLKQLRVLISGEGGVGKTTLAGYVAMLARSDDPGVRPFGHQAISVSLTADLDDTVTTDAAILDVIVAKLEEDVHGMLPVYVPLVEEMLAQGRVLLVLDGMSEMPAAVAKALRQFIPRKKVRAVVVTSRSETIIGSINAAVVRPDRISKDHLPAFIREFARSHGIKLDKSLLSAAEELATIADDGVTPLLVRLYLDMISGAQRPAPEIVPVNVAELMRRYVLFLNDKISAQDKLPRDIVMEVGQAVADLCCVRSRSFRASPADAGAARRAVGEANASRLEYFVDKLSVLRRVGTGNDHLKFAIDALCEYLAGFSLSRAYRSDRSDTLSRLEPGDDAEEQLALLQFTDRIEACVNADLFDDGLTGSERATLEGLRLELVVLRGRLRGLLEVASAKTGP